MIKVVPDLRVRAINSTSNDTSSIVSSASDSVGLSAPTTTSATSDLPTPDPGATDSNNDSSSSGLSTGAKAGIGVGAGVGALLLLAGLIYFIRSKRNSAGPGATGVYAAGETMETKQVQPFPAELAAGGRDDVPRLQRVELQG